MNLLTHVILLFLMQTAEPAYSSGSYYDSLKTDSQLTLLDSAVKTFFIESCCQSTLEKCLKGWRSCPIAPRFYDFTCWLILRENNYDTVMRQLNKRYDSFFGPAGYHLAPSFLPSAGDSAAPVVITAYVSASCNLCKKVCIPLHRAVTQGPLKGKARLQLKPATMQAGDMAFLAAGRQGKFWELFLSLEQVTRRLDEKFLITKAKKAGLNTAQFENDLYNEKLKEILRNNKNEALANGVEISPTLFINNRRYQSYKDPQWVVDIVEYEYERTK